MIGILLLIRYNVLNYDRNYFIWCVCFYSLAFLCTRGGEKTMSWCLTKDVSLKFKKALKDGEINPVKLAAMESITRRMFLSDYVGEENAKQINALFEGKLLLKNQQRGMISWAKKVTGMTPQVKRDIISRIERLQTVLSPKEEQQFLQDLASTRLKIDVTQEEAKVISDLSKKIQETRTLAKEDFTFPTEIDRLNYGMAKVNLENTINELKIQSRAISFREEPLRKIASIISEVPGVAKSLVASFDNSFWGRQGIKTLLDVRTSKVWFKNFLKSWVNIGRELKGKDAMNLIRADIYSRLNALNGKYDAGNYGLSVLSEEAYPSSWPGKIPLFKRLYKASESAYNGGALRLRADLADRLIKVAEKQGVDTLNKTQAQGMGSLISSMTGRGGLGKAEVLSKEINVGLFSSKFLKSNFDTLTAHQLDPKATPFTKKEAAKNLLSIVATIASVLGIAKILDKDSIDEDPRSTNFGKVKVFGHWTDITGGMSSLVTLASRLVPTVRNGEWGLWSKSSTGTWTNLTAGKYGQQTALDVFENFWEGKVSPVAGLIRDLWKGKNFQGEPITVKNALSSLVTPISIQNFNQRKDDPNSFFVFGSMIIDALGFSTSTYTYKANWDTSTGVELKQFKEKVGSDKFKKANNDYNRAYSVWFNALSQTLDYKKLSDEGKDKLTTDAKAKLKDKIFKEYNFVYKQNKKINREVKTIKELLPK